jgi:uracil-DNA glycosylase family 4
MSFHSPPSDCALCPRLCTFREENRITYPSYYNAPVPAFGTLDATHLVVGLAPGLHGANQTGRPFTGDYAGDVLYGALLYHGLATGTYGKHTDDGLRLQDVRITNAVRCVPPQNAPTTEEIRTCRAFLKTELASMNNLRAILVLGLIAHKAVLAACGLKISAFPFAHGVVHTLPQGIKLHCSYHTSRYNINTGRLTEAMFDAVMEGFAQK